MEPEGMHLALAFEEFYLPLMWAASPKSLSFTSASDGTYRKGKPIRLFPPLTLPNRPMVANVRLPLIENTADHSFHSFQGARTVFLPELYGKLPLRTCRGVIAHMQLPVGVSEVYPDNAPSILSDAWLSVEGPHNLQLGSTWEWNSRNYLPNVPAEEASKALTELLPKASAIYPFIKNWDFTRASAGLRAMPPITPHGSLPLLGCLDDFVSGNHTCKYWLFGGLGSRGLLYHGWLGKILVQAVLSCNEDLLPSELTCWRNKK